MATLIFVISMLGLLYNIFGLIFLQFVKLGKLIFKMIKDIFEILTM